MMQHVHFLLFTTISLFLSILNRDSVTNISIRRYMRRAAIEGNAGARPFRSSRLTLSKWAAILPFFLSSFPSLLTHTLSNPGLTYPFRLCACSLLGKHTLTIEIYRSFVLHNRSKSLTIDLTNEILLLRNRVYFHPLGRSIVTLSTVVAKFLQDFSYLPFFVVGLICESFECDSRLLDYRLLDGLLD